MLAVGVGAGRAASKPALAELHARIAGAVPRRPLPPYLAERPADPRLRGPGEAAEAARAAARRRLACRALRIGGQYGPAGTFCDPFGGGVRLAPAAIAAAAGAARLGAARLRLRHRRFRRRARRRRAAPRRPANISASSTPPDGGPPVGLYALKSYDQLLQPLGRDDD